MSGCDLQLLSVYLDGELPAGQAEIVERHLRECPSCAEQMRLLREDALRIQQQHFDSLRPDELARLHQTIDADQEDHPIFRLGLVLSALAASVMIISSAWLMELPARKAVHPMNPVARAPLQSWERVAMELRVDPLPLPNQNEGQLRLADAQFAQWMLEGLAK